MSILRGGRTQINVDQLTVVPQIQQLHRLETVSYTMDKIISDEHVNAYLRNFWRVTACCWWCTEKWLRGLI